PSSGPAATPPTLRYTDFAAWQRERWAPGPRLDELLNFWSGRLRGAPVSLALPLDRPRSSLPTFDGARSGLLLSKELADGVAQFARKRGVTPFVTLLAAFVALLYRYTGQSDVLVGSVFSGRGRAEIDGLLGYFSNVLPLRMEFRPDASFDDLLNEVRNAYLDAAAHAELPIEKLVLEIEERSPGERPPVPQVMFTTIVEDAAVPLLGGAATSLLAIDRGVSRLDLSVAAALERDGLRLAVEYRTQLFDAPTIDALLTHFGVLLEAVVAQPACSIARLPLLRTSEISALVSDYNATETPYPRDSTLTELLAAQARRTPAATALEGFDASGSFVQLTYAELDARAETVASFLRSRGIGVGAGVGVCVDRTVELVVGLLGVLKSGGHYVPLDPDYPAERIAFVVRDASLALVLTLERLRPVVPFETASAVALDGDLAAVVSADRTFAVRAGPADLAYVIYTSGSTGRPKGVMVPHRALVNFLCSMAREPGLVSTDRLLAVTTVSFDIAGLELWLPLVVGAAVVMAPREAVVDGRRLAELLTSSGATMLQATPVTWRLLLAAGWRGNAGLTMLCGGEALPPDLAEALEPLGAALWNMYGPTETTIWSALERVGAGQPIGLGHPIANTQLYVLEAGGDPAPLGLPGELWIGGDGVAAGYFGRPELTQERFAADPFRAPGDRMYRTGDLVRRHADGRLQYLGRLDTQVKLRGFRIELGEIEAALVALPEVEQAVAALREDRTGEPVLVAYVVPAPRSNFGADGADAEFRQQLRRTLPDYMIPRAYVLLETLPLTPNGKLDRGGLPAPDFKATRAIVAPRTAAEKELLAIFAGILRRDDVGVDDDFFELGGHSLLAMRLLDRVAVVSAQRITLRDFFETPTVAGLAAALAAARSRGAAQLERIPRRSTDEPVSLTPSQRALWLLGRGTSDAGAY
ncbi:MAG: amino acid adenylation domain-containing protein, partial [Candidatus Eremiobacteraeota bacterium]|nr:amino acid adenylation domain-containing protein [Candidatus Eremiobacteraeota bacterium]